MITIIGYKTIAHLARNDYHELEDNLTDWRKAMKYARKYKERYEYVVVRDDKRVKIIE